MKVENVTRALTLAFELITTAQSALAHISAMIANARNEGRDITDAELDQLAASRQNALESFRQQVGG